MSVRSVEDVLRRRRSICSCPSAQVFNLIIGLSIFSRKGRKSAAQSNCSSSSSRSSEIKAATQMLLSCSGSSGCSLVSQIVPRQFSEAFDIMFWRGYTSSAVCKRFAATPSIDFRHLTALSFDLSRRLGLVWPGLLDLLLVFASLLLGLAYFAY